MRDNALYFPYINVPNNVWFHRILLYWDRVSAIVPYEYVNHPEWFAPSMRDLVMAGLVEQIFPGAYIDTFPNFTSSFMRYIYPRRHLYRSGTAKQLLHMEKMGHIADELQRLGLAHPQTYPWYAVDAWVADAFMAYLATLLGGVATINAAPVTHHYTSSRLLGGGWAGYPTPSKTARFARRAASRHIILRHLFPVPAGPIDLDDIVRFKRNHGALLRSFRYYVEARCIDLATIPDPEARQERTRAMDHELKMEVMHITEVMRGTWSNLTFRWITPLLGIGAALTATDLSQPAWQVGGGVAALGGSLVGAIYQAAVGARQRQEILQHPLAYAAFVQRLGGSVQRGSS